MVKEKAEKQLVLKQMCKISLCFSNEYIAKKMTNSDYEIMITYYKSDKVASSF